MAQTRTTRRQRESSVRVTALTRRKPPGTGSRWSGTGTVFYIRSGNQLEIIEIVCRGIRENSCNAQPIAQKLRHGARHKTSK